MHICKDVSDNLFAVSAGELDRIFWIADVFEWSVFCLSHREKREFASTVGCQLPYEPCGCES